MKKISALKLSSTVDLHMEGLRRLRNMWLDENVLCYEDGVPEKRHGDPMIFLAGPTSRDGMPDYKWRKDAVHYLRLYGYSGNILVPEPRGYSYLADMDNDDFTVSEKIYQWEYDGIRRATCLVFWIPRNMEQLLGITTNREFGQALVRAEHDIEFSRRLYIGWPANAKKMGSHNFELMRAKVGRKEGDHFTSLEELCKDLASLFEIDSDIPF